ncbi:MAG: glutathione S-transferase N-terminal domain-containing protein [Myxococcota bacterium]
MTTSTTSKPPDPFRWPAPWAPKHPDRIQLYSMATPNGQKVGVALEELGLPYELHRIDITKGDQHDEEYLRINPNGKIPSIVDPHGPAGPLPLMESAVILNYLARKGGGLLPDDERLYWETQQWLSFQIASVGPMFGQFGHFFAFARDKTSDTYALERYTAEVRRLLGVLDRRLSGRTFLVGEQFTIADVATFPWIAGLSFYKAQDHLGYAEFAHVVAFVERCLARPAVQRGMKVGA